MAIINNLKARFGFGSRTREVNREVMEERAKGNVSTPNKVYGNSNDYIGPGGFVVASGDSVYLWKPGMEPLFVLKDGSKISCLAVYDNNKFSYGVGTTIVTCSLADHSEEHNKRFFDTDYVHRARNVSCLHVHTDGKPYDCGAYGVFSGEENERVFPKLLGPIHALESKGNAIFAITNKGVSTGGGSYYIHKRGLISMCYSEKNNYMLCGTSDEIIKFSPDLNQTFPPWTGTVCTRKGPVQAIRIYNGDAFDASGKYIFNTFSNVRGENPILEMEKDINDFVSVDDDMFDLFLKYAERKQEIKK